jgi:hypothetical protein
MSGVSVRRLEFSAPVPQLTDDWNGKKDVFETTLWPLTRIDAFELPLDDLPHFFGVVPERCGPPNRQARMASPPRSP